MKRKLFIIIGLFAVIFTCRPGIQVHVWEKVELTFQARNVYKNPYTEVDLWVQLKGPDFDKRVYGFWEGENVYKVRILATKSGKWTWTCHSNVNDQGLNGKSGSFSAIDWTEKEKEENPNRRGTIRPTSNGRALEYADGKPFFLLCDTHWSAGTWRYPFKGKEPDPNYQPGEDIGFEEFIQHVKKKGFNSIGFISCFPNWAVDDYNATLTDDSGIEIRKPWPKPGKPGKCIDMHDEDGDRPFFFPGKCDEKQDACADFDRINPAYWQNLDKKMDYLSANGFIPYFESVRRDHLQSWRAYHDFKKSFSRFLRYLRARYNTNNMIFCLVHGDHMGGDWQSAVDEACDYYYEKYGPMPFDQPTTLMASHSTLHYFGHTDESSWLKMHASGNVTRNHLIYRWIEMQFNHPNPIPVFNNEPYYVGHENPGGKIAGGNPPADPERDSYYGRAQMYGSVLSGGLAGHVYGSQSWMGVTTGEPDMGTKATRFWISFSFLAHSQVQYLGKFMLSEGVKYQNLILASEDLNPRKSKGALDHGLDGWAYMMRTEDKSLAMLYFENECEKATILNMLPGKNYNARWFNPRTGVWVEEKNLTADENGKIQMPNFPSQKEISEDDWAVKLKMIE